MTAPLIIISGPSGVGKTTTTNHVLARIPALTKVITITTRTPRSEEKHGVDYFFVSESTFTELAHARAFLEINTFGSDRYGTPRSLLTFLERGRPRIVLPDINGTRMLKKQVPTAVCLWLEAPLEILAERLSIRSSESLEKQKERLAIARNEIAQARTGNMYKYIIDMTDFAAAEENIVQIITEQLQ